MDAAGISHFRQVTEGRLSVALREPTARSQCSAASHPQGESSVKTSGTSQTRRFYAPRHIPFQVFRLFVFTRLGEEGVSQIVKAVTS